MGCIYVIRNEQNNKAYIGQTRATWIHRKGQHLSELRRGRHENEKLQRAWDKYGEASFSWEVLVDGVDIAALDAEEIRYIALFDTVNNGYNISAGGQGRTLQPVTWDGVEYHSLAEAAQACGVSPATMVHRLKRGTKTTDLQPTPPMQCKWNGKTYPSLKAAALSVGINTTTLSRHLRKGYKRDEDVPVRNTPCMWEGVSYPSFYAAAKSAGVTKGTMAKYIRAGFAAKEDVVDRRMLKNVSR